ncbi:MAG: O-antigen ligase family protein [Candidatus Kerfeldbacteria bacterium]|nr:O-antigen ligase family protein [Candidatus Kerfeldbacteria bacterium]
MILSDWLLVLLLPLAILAWYRFDLALYAVLALLPTYLLRFNILGVPTTWLELAIYILLLVFLVQGKWRDYDWLKFKSTKGWLLWVGLWLLAALVAATVATDKRLALGILKGWIIDPLVLAYLFINELNLASLKEKWWRQVIMSFWLGGVVTGLGSIIMAVSNQTGRIYGWYDSPNVLAMFLVPILLLTGLCSLTNVFKINLTVAQKVIWWLGIGIMFLALAGSNSYTGLISLIASLAIFILLTKFNRPKFTVGLGVGLLLLNLLLPVVFVKYNYWFPLSHRNDKYQVTSGQVRLVLWREALEVVRLKPILGLGLGEWQPYFLQQIMPRLPEAKQSGLAIELYYASLFPHNLLLTTWLYLGLGGVVALAGLIIKACLAAGNRKNLIIPLTLLFSILVQGLVDTPWFKNDLAIMVWLLFSVFLWSDNQTVEPVNSKLV